MRTDAFLTSTPALAALLRTAGTPWPRPVWTHPSWLPAGYERLAQMYVVGGENVTEEATAASHVVSGLAERLRRLETAYAEWEHFDAPAYFDLTVDQCARLLKLSERVNTVHIRFFPDTLLPAFVRAADFAVHAYLPAAERQDESPVASEQFLQRIQPGMVELWQQLCATIQQARDILAEDIGYLAANGATEEREQWRGQWLHAPVAGVASALMPALEQIATLTLSFEFPLPAWKQPDRVRRLRTNRNRQRTQNITRLSR
jgi:hypothetical protein